PAVLAGLNLEGALATSVAAVLDVARGVSFAVLGVWGGWRGGALPLAGAPPGVAGSFGPGLFGGTLPPVWVGGVVFGLASGLAYTAALYYALVLKNASVDAGGAHEGLIGAGFALGPVAGLIAHATAAPLGGYVIATVTSVLPLVATCTVLAVR